MMDKYISIYLIFSPWHLLLQLQSQSNACLFPQSLININDVNTSAIRSIANTSFPPRAIRTPQQLQPECKTKTAIAKYRPTNSCDPSNYNCNNGNYKIQTCPTSITATTKSCQTPFPSTSSTLQQHKKCVDNGKRGRKAST